MHSHLADKGGAWGAGSRDLLGRALAPWRAVRGPMPSGTCSPSSSLTADSWSPAPLSAWTTFSYQRSHFCYWFTFFLLRNVFAVKTREKTTFACGMRKLPLLRDSAEQPAPQKRKTDPPWVTETKGRRNPPQRDSQWRTLDGALRRGRVFTCVSNEMDGYTYMAFFVLEKTHRFPKGWFKTVAGRRSLGRNSFLYLKYKYGVFGDRGGDFHHCLTWEGLLPSLCRGSGWASSARAPVSAGSPWAVPRHRTGLWPTARMPQVTPRWGAGLSELPQGVFGSDQIMSSLGGCFLSKLFIQIRCF